MQLTQHQLTILSHLATQAAIEAGEMIAGRVGESFTVKTKAGGQSNASQVLTEVDLASQAILLKHLEPTCSEYDLGLLSEESPDDSSRFAHDYFWAIDPLDGTLAFIEKTPGFAVSIALLTKAGEPVIGVVYNPSTNECFSAVKGCGVLKNGEVYHFPKKDFTCFHLFCDRSFLLLPHYKKTLTILKSHAARAGIKELVIHPESGAVINALGVLHHAQACYFKWPFDKPGGGSIWDFAATACIAAEAGAWVSDAIGNDLPLNTQNSTFMNHSGVLFASQKNLGRSIANSWKHLMP